MKACQLPTTNATKFVGGQNYEKNRGIKRKIKTEHLQQEVFQAAVFLDH